MRRPWSILLLWALACLAGCAAPRGNADQDRHDGFYGAVSGGVTRAP